jgi:hypothetical protein
LSRTSRLLKTLRSSFDGLRTNGERFEMIEKIPFVLRLSNTKILFSASCWTARIDVG